MPTSAEKVYEYPPEPMGPLPPLPTMPDSPVAPTPPVGSTPPATNNPPEHGTPPTTTVSVEPKPQPEGGILPATGWEMLWLGAAVIVASVLGLAMRIAAKSHRPGDNPPRR